jgi:hypothetical protein
VTYGELQRRDCRDGTPDVAAGERGHWGPRAGTYRQRDPTAKGAENTCKSAEPLRGLDTFTNYETVRRCTRFVPDRLDPALPRSKKFLQGG